MTTTIYFIAKNTEHVEHDFLLPLCDGREMSPYYLNEYYHDQDCSIVLAGRLPLMHIRGHPQKQQVPHGIESAFHTIPDLGLLNHYFPHDKMVNHFPVEW
jgi:hypothetical protein